MRILIVADNDNGINILEGLLAGQGYQTHKAKNGEQALSILQNSKIDLIIMDILAPVLEELSLCRNLKSNPQYQDIPIIIHAETYNGNQDEELALKMGADRFLIKPCEAETLYRTVAELLSAEPSPRVNEEKEEEILKLYNQRLIRKLEKKIAESDLEVLARQDAESKLQRSESLLQTTQRIGKIGGWEWIIAENVMFWTDETYSIHECTRTDFTPAPDEYIAFSLNCYEEPYRSEILTAFNRCCELGEPYSLEVPFITFQGTKILSVLLQKPFMREAG